MSETTLKVGVVGGLGLMASPMAKHWKPEGPVRALRVHDRGKPGARHEQSRESWRRHGASLVGSLEQLVRNDLDGLFVCCGKNGDDVALIGKLAHLLSSAGPGKFLCHMSTVSTGFAEAAERFCRVKGVTYVNYPLTGGVTGAEKGTMLILACGNPALFERLKPGLSLLGNPKHFGESPGAGAQVKFMGHMMVFNGLVGIGSAAATHAECFQGGKLGGAEQVEFFDFLNGGAGGTRQWDLVLRQALLSETWDTGFFLKYAAVDAIYTAQLCLERGLSSFAIQPLLDIAFAFSYALNHSKIELGTQAIVRDLVKERARELDAFLLRHAGPRGDSAEGIRKCIDSLPEPVRSSVRLRVGPSDFSP